MFQFKQFAISQLASAMKLGTDSVSLGAWAVPKAAKKMLDIGTGTGILALMMAQRFSELVIDAIELDTNASMDAMTNFKASPWFHRIHFFETSLQEYVINTTLKYDAIITNPPYFQDGIISSNTSRAMARHTNTLTYDDLFACSAKLLNPNGQLFVILPTDALASAEDCARKHHLYIHKQCLLHHFLHKNAKRVLLELSFIQKEKDLTRLCMKCTGGSYTDEYYSMVKDFYLQL